MPQISPMKWLALNLLTQSSIFQSISLLNTKKIFTINQNKFKIPMNKMNWKW